MTSDAPRNLLIVEGDDDKYALGELLHRNGVPCEDCLRKDTLSKRKPRFKDLKPEVVNILSAGGLLLDLYSSKNEEIRFAVAALKHNLELPARVGIVIDADLDPEGRWNELREILQQLGVNGTIPETIPSEGYVGTIGGNTRIGIWMLPNNSDPGMLETLLHELVPAGDTCWEYAKSATLEAKRDHNAPFHTGEGDEADHTHKAQIRTWLSWQHPPGQPFGLAIQEHMLEHESPLVAVFVDWVKATFGI